MKDYSKIKHLAIIPDGNRRWAQKNGYKGVDVYRMGVQRLYEALGYLVDCNIDYFTFWSSSLNNLMHRSNNPLKVFDTLYKESFNRLLEDKLIQDYEVRVQVYGAWRGLLKLDTERIIDDVVLKTKDHNGLVFSILIGYDGRLERGSAAMSLVRDVKEGIISYPVDYLEMDSLLCKYSWTSTLPHVDLIVRTGSWEDPHMSASFLTFLSGESQFSFPPILWPDFTVVNLETTLNNFLKRDRRYGQ